MTKKNQSKLFYSTYILLAFTVIMALYKRNSLPQSTANPDHIGTYKSYFNDDKLSLTTRYLFTPGSSATIGVKCRSQEKTQVGVDMTFVLLVL